MVVIGGLMQGADKYYIVFKKVERTLFSMQFALSNYLVILGTVDASNVHVVLWG